jgi:hypothetical protein
MLVVMDHCCLRFFAQADVYFLNEWQRMHLPGTSSRVLADALKVQHLVVLCSLISLNLDSISEVSANGDDNEAIDAHVRLFIERLHSRFEASRYLVGALLMSASVVLFLCEWR